MNIHNKYMNFCVRKKMKEWYKIEYLVDFIICLNDKSQRYIKCNLIKASTHEQYKH